MALNPTNKSVPIVPSDLHKALATKPIIESVWGSLTSIAREDFIRWIKSAKLAETRKRRIRRTVEMLTAGKRRPCCYAVVPMNFYRALGANPKAKAQWRGLTPNARRDFISWIDSAKQGKTNELRIDKACELLAAGKLHH